eukprot:1029593-Pyramimonas_sp.AAC.1
MLSLTTRESPLGLRIMRVIVIARDLISCFIDVGYYSAHPTHGLLTRDTAAGHANDERRAGAYALDCCIRAAVETDDFVEAWAGDLGKLSRAEIRRQGMKLQ